MTKVTVIFFFLQNLRFQPSSDSDESGCEVGGSSSLTVLLLHASWLPDLAKWGGISSPGVRRHWCGCVVAALDSVRTAALELTVREKRVFQSLLESRDFWTDEQVNLTYMLLRPIDFFLLSLLCSNQPTP